MTDSDRRDLGARLEAIARRAGATLDRDRTLDATRRAVETAAPLLLVVPVFAFLAALAIRAGNSGLRLPPWPLLLVLTPAPALVFVLLRRFEARRDRVGEGEALGAVDAKCELEDRLANAREFIARDARGPFVEAALADAEGHLDRADWVPVGGGAAELALRARDFGALGAAVLLLAIVPFVGGAGATLADDAGRGVVAPPPGTVARAEPNARAENPPRRNDEAARVQPETRRPNAPNEASEAQARRDDQPLSDRMKESRGETGQGRSADASSSSGASEARGVPTDQAQSSRNAKKPNAKKKEKKDRGRKETEAAPRKKPEEESGATAGRGAASGSNKSPAASTWSSKDQVVSDDEEDLEDDEEVDDEFDDNDARGGMQPQLRDRKPPVNRDLGIGFGNGKNPDANGRGGPSEQKKSRGVASLVLGVSIPDHVKGRPSPGKTKITQERVEPREDRVGSIDAAARARRASSSGPLSRPALDANLRTLLRDYFDARRKEDARSENIESDQP
ncbi:MAG: hypothetical protein R3F20_06655 [Planctomycetota bacterium]